LVPSLAGGSFSGIFSVDVDLLPISPSVTLSLVSWNVVVRNSVGTAVQTFVNGPGTQTGFLLGRQDGVQSDGMNFHDAITNNRLTLAFFQGFDGQGAVQQSITTDFITLYSEFQLGNALSTINVTQGSSAAQVGTPEPGTIGLLSAGALALAAAKSRSSRKPTSIL
jgi:hypothetical protein